MSKSVHGLFRALRFHNLGENGNVQDFHRCQQIERKCQQKLV